MISQIISCALLNRLIGNRAEDVFSSAVMVRVIGTGLMATALNGAEGYTLLIWASLFFWRTIAGSWNIGAAYHGHVLTIADSPIKKIIALLTAGLSETTEKKRRIKGSIQQGVKHLSLIPYAILVNVDGLGLIAFFGLVYYLVGKFGFQDSRAHVVTEYILGAMVALIYFSGS